MSEANNATDKPHLLRVPDDFDEEAFLKNRSDLLAQEGNKFAGKTYILFSADGKEIVDSYSSVESATKTLNEADAAGKPLVCEHRTT